MADNVTANPGVGGATFAADDLGGGVLAPRMKLLVGPDGSGVDVGSLGSGTGLLGILAAIGATEFFFSSANTSVAQLASGATFTGTLEPIINAQAFSILMKSDQPGTLTLREYIDAAGTQPMPVKTFNLLANVGFSRAFIANGNYFNLTFQNTGGVATTSLNINVAFGTLPAVNALGNVPVGLSDVGGIAFALGQQAQGASLPISACNDVSVLGVASIAAINVDLLTNIVSGWYDAAAFQSATIQVVGSAGITAGAIFFEQTNDTSIASAGNVWAVDELTTLTPTPNIAAITIAASTTRLFGGPILGRYVRVRVSTAFATANVQVAALFSQSPYWRQVLTVNQATAANLNVTVPANLAVSLSQISAQTAMNPAANGSTNRALVTAQATAISNTDQNATAFAGAGRINGTIVASANAGSGAVISAEINVSVLTLGTATSIVFILQESAGGTNFTDIWTSDPIAVTSIIRVPAICVAGRRRWVAHSIGGTSTTVTTTITALELPSGYVVNRMYRDAYSATNPLASVINSVTQSVTTLVNAGGTCMTATSQFTSPCIVEDCSIISMFVVLGNGPTVTTQPVLTLQLSNNLTDWWSSGAIITGAGNGMYAASLTGVSFRYARIAVTTAAVYSVGNYTITSVGINAGR